MRKKFLFLLLIIGALALLFVYGSLSVNWFRQYADTMKGQVSVQSILIIAGSALYVYLGIRFFNRHVNSLF